jgi:predicted enzyme related to lactoylglutathione lyase
METEQINQGRIMSKAKKEVSRIVWFEVPADDTKRAGTFYQKLFGWKINPMPHMDEYFHMDTGGPDAAPDGAIMKRMHPQHGITSYVSVPSVAKYITKIEKLGGSICKPKTAVPGMGYFAICNDTENNTFAIWEMNDKAK